MSISKSPTLISVPRSENVFLHAGSSAPPGSAPASVAASLTRSSASAGAALDANVHLQLLFQYYCRFGRSGVDHDIDTLDNVMFAKFTRDSPELVDRVLTPTECDLIWFKTKDKTQRRVSYGQWLDMLAAMAAVKFPGEADPQPAFSAFLSAHVLSSPVAQGIAQAVAAGLISVEPGGPTPRSRSPARAPRSRSPAASATAAYAAAAAARSRSVSPSAAARRAGGAPPSPGGGLQYSAYMHGAAAKISALAAEAAAAAEAAIAAGAPDPVSAPAPAPPRAPSPGSVYEVLARTAREMQATAAAAAAAAAASAAPASPTLPPPPAHSRPMSVSGTLRSGGARSSGSSASLAPSLTIGSQNPFRAVLSGGDFVISGQSVGVAGSGASRPKAPPRSPGGAKYDMLGTASFSPSLAGEANAPGSIFERLANPATFTGVYRRAWETDGRINQYTETGVSLRPSRYVGNTNTNSDEHITDIRFLLRPNLLLQPGGGTAARPAFKPAGSLP